MTSAGLTLLGDGSPEADLLRRAAEVARLAAADRLDQRLLGLWDAFALGAVGADTCAVLGVDLRFLDRLDALARLDRALRASDLSCGRASIVDPDTGGGRAVDDRVRTLRPGGSALRNIAPAAGRDHLRSGHTLVLNDVQDTLGGEASALARDASTAFRSVAQVNAYVSVGDAPGFGTHWDDHDVVIVQVAGRKLWEVHRPLELGAVKDFTPRGSEGEVVWSGVLTEGTALAIPRGWPHRVSGVEGEMSVHLTLSIRRASGLDVVARLAPEELASGRPGTAAIDAALASFRAELVAWPDHGPVLLQEATAVAFVEHEITAHLPGGVVFAPSDPVEGDDALRLRTGGRDLVVRRADAPILAELLTGGWQSPDAVAAAVGCGRGSVVAVADALAGAGALGLRWAR